MKKTNPPNDPELFGAYKSLLANCSYEFPDTINFAYEAAGRSYWKRYENILKRHEGEEALWLILYLDGYRGRCLEFAVDHYRRNPDPLLTYSNDPYVSPQRMTSGQIAIKVFRKREAHSIQSQCQEAQEP